MPLDPRQLQADADAPPQPSSPNAVRALVGLALKMKEAQERMEAAEAEAKAWREKYDHFRKEELPERMNAAGLVAASGKGQFSLPDGSTVFLAADMHAHVPKEKEGAFHAWLEKNGNGDLIKRTVFYSTLRAFLKEQVSNGVTLPEYVQAHPYLVARIRKPAK